ncbi:DUF2744 domain-containing protein [Nocardia sp. NPDC051052]|uniref:phage gene 29 protein family protein n=1 Tax=Nocardia sp. NPDC051052 TaxID=3364322 RepID=UPI0037B4DB4B
MALPLQHECDPDDPATTFLWAFLALPGPAQGPMLVPVQILEQWSERLWRLGFRHHPDLQELEYQPPAPTGGHWLASPGQWVPRGTAVAPEVGTPDISELTIAQRTQIIAQLRESGELAHLVDARLLEPDQASVGTAHTTTPLGADGDGGAR